MNTPPYPEGDFVDPKIEEKDLMTGEDWAWIYFIVIWILLFIIARCV